MDLNNIKLNEQVQMILDVANQLRGPFKEDEYQNVIIPMTILRRFECILESTKDEVLEEVKNGKPNDKVLRDITGLSIYNTSKFNLTNLQEEASKLATNLKDYLDHFNDVAKSIFTQLKFYETIDALEKGHKLFVVVKKFSNTDLSVEHVNSMQMGYIMEEIIRTYSENASAGDHFTPREVIRCLTQLLLAEGCDDLYENGKIVTLGDFACGTGGMLSEGYRMIKELNDSTMVNLYGQDNNGWYEAIALAEMIIKGQDPDNVKLVSSTLTTDAFPGQNMRLILMNPPFGLSYSKKEIGEEEYAKITGHNRKNDWYEGGLPQTSDSQTLFWQFAINKLEPTKGRAAIICNASPLFSGTESKIRKWFMENDYIEAIIQFCPELFYNTGITIYAFIFNKNKSEKRKNKIQIIDASNICIRMSKGLGYKRNKISEEEDNNQIAEIVKLYSDFKESKNSKILTKEDFYFKEVIVNRPFRRNFKIDDDRIQNLWVSLAFNKLYSDEKYNALAELPVRTAAQVQVMREMEDGKKEQDRILNVLYNNVSSKVWKNRDDFIKHLKELLPELKQSDNKTLLKGIYLALSDYDETADCYFAGKNRKIEADPDLKDTISIPFRKNVEEYFNQEIKPYWPEAWFDNTDTLDDLMLDDTIKCEINFSRFFYKYVQPQTSEELIKEIEKIEEIESGLEDIIYGRK